MEFVHSFNESKQYEASRQNVEEKILQQCGFISFTKTQLSDDIHGADYFAYRQNCDKKFCIDFKHRSVKRDDIALEYCSLYKDKSQEKLGWARDKSKITHMIIYVFPDSSFYVLHFKKILSVIEREEPWTIIDMSTLSVKHKKYFVSKTPNKNYFTYSICIPIRDLTECIIMNDSF